MTIDSSSRSRRNAARAALLTALLAALPAALPAADTPDGERPRIGLVLGGGGAKGAAHVGVLKVLEELRVPIDCIAGTSMGALVGASYALGYSAAELEALIQGTDWSATVGSAGLRDRTPIARKLDGVQYSNTLEFGLAGGRLRTPGGFLNTQEIDELLRRIAQPGRLAPSFDALPIPFRAIATDIVSGEMVVLGDGDLAVAMRASMAVPGAFAPVTVGERVLVDGGMVRNVPIDIARGLCADVVIAVWLPSPPPDPAALGGGLAVIGRSLDVAIGAGSKVQIETLTPADVGIPVALEGIGSSSFELAPLAIPQGEAAARAKLAELARLGVDEAEYRRWRRRFGATEPPARIAEVRVSGLDRVSPDFVRGQMRIAPGQVVSDEDIAADTTRIFALGDFQSVGYRLTGDAAAAVLDVTPLEKAWGPNFVHFDLGLAASTGGDVLFSLRADHRRTWMNRRGGTWLNWLEIGQNAELGTAFYQPLDRRHRVFAEPGLEARRTLEDVYIDGDRLATYELLEYFGTFELGVNLGTRAQLRAGVELGGADATVATGDRERLPNNPSVQEANFVARAVYDTRDSVFLPTRGTYAEVHYRNSGEWLNGDFDYQTLEAVVQRAFATPRGNVIYVAAAAGGDVEQLFGEFPLPAYRQFMLGGIRSFPGLLRGELRGDSYWTAYTSYMWKLADIQSLFGQALYAGIRLQGGRMGGRIDRVRDGAIYGASVNIGGRTPLGPLLLSIGGTDTGAFEVQFAVGRPVDEGSVLDKLQ